MSSAVETVDYRGYTIEIHQDDDPGNPYKDFDQLGEIVLHAKAEGHFGWTTNEEYADLLNRGLEDILERGFTRNLHGPRGALATVVRWLKAFHGVTVALPFGAHEHSGTSVYLGDGPDLFDSAGWDSGWIGLTLDTPERRTVMGFDEKPGPDGKPWDSPATIEEALRGDFETFRSWVAGEVYGYVIKDPDGDEIEDGSCWGFYGDSEWASWAQKDGGDGYVISECKALIDADITARRDAPITFTITTTVQIDRAAWATEYGKTPAEVHPDVAGYYTADAVKTQFQGVPNLLGPLGTVTAVTVQMPTPIEGDSTQVAD